MAFALDTALSLSLMAFLSMHLKLVASNCTSIEMYEKQRIDPWPYNHGCMTNIYDCFGQSIWMWGLPFHTEDEKQRLLDSVLSPRLLEEPRSETEESV